VIARNFPGVCRIDSSSEQSTVSAILSSLWAFIGAGVRPRSPLAKAIVLVLVVKLIGIAGMKVFMFPESAQPFVDANAMARVVGVSAPTRQ
jgi:hypothetical protein